VLSFLPPLHYRFSLQRGQKGSDVWALQINLNLLGASLVEDGDFGPATERAVRAYQASQRLSVDGQPGPKTQTQMCLQLLDRYGDDSLPAGLARGVIEGESGYAVGCVNTDAAGGIDCGWTQDRVTTDEYNDARFHRAFCARDAFSALARALHAAAKRYAGKPGARTAKQAWWCGTLSWNWPAAAIHYANADAQSWHYVARWFPSVHAADDGRTVQRFPDGSENREYTMDTTAQWITKYGVSGVGTGAQWADFYVKTKWKYTGDNWPRP